jgi:HEAT repeat protein
MDSLVLYIASYALIVMTIKIQDMQLTKFVSIFYDTLESKRLFPIVSTGARVGTIVGGISLSFILKKINSTDIPYVCIGLTVINALIVFYISFQNRRKLNLSVVRQKAKYRRRRGLAGLESLKQGYQFVKRSDLLKVMAVAAITMMLSLEILRYHYSGIFQDSFESSDQLTAFLGGFAAFSNIVGMVVPLFITPRLVGLFGVGTVNVFYPISILISYFSFIIAPRVSFFSGLNLGLGISKQISPFEFISAAFGRFVKVPLNKTLFQPVTYLLYNAVPHTLRGRAYAFITGIMIPIGSFFAGIVILLAKRFNIDIMQILYLGLGISFITTILGFVQKRKYVDSLITLLKGRNVDLSMIQDTDLAQISANELNRLIEMLNSDNEEMNIFTVEVLGEVGGKRVIEEFEKIIDEKSDRVKEAIIKSLGKMGDDSVLPLIRRYLDSPIEYLRMSAVESIWKLGNSHQIAETLTGLINDPTPEIRGIVLCLLAKNPDTGTKQKAIEKFEEMLFSSNITEKLAAIEAAGRVRLYSYRDKITEFFDDENPKVQTTSIRAFEELISESETQYIPLVLKLLNQDKNRAVRREASNVIVKLNNEAALDDLLKVLNDPSPKVRENIREAIIKIGAPAEKPLITLLKDVMAPMRAKEQAIIALNKLGTLGIEGFLLIFAQSELKQAYHNITQIAVLEEVRNKRAVELLIKAFEDRIEDIKSITLKVLETLGNAEVLRLIEQTLQRKDVDSRTKANALETLGNVGEKELIRIMLPLYDTISNREKAEFAEEKWEMKLLDQDEILYLALNHTDPWIQACGIFAIGELGVRKFDPYLRKSLEADDPYIREAAEEALRKIKDPKTRIINIKNLALSEF